ncbi:MAG: type II toxin-antitoxin system RelE/ParE family toxin [Oscillospiraceae bacterium]|nr:type II toxin-antitoxin system RelE/ParE family toxin [Oscillospiraceae bacterium]
MVEVKYSEKALRDLEHIGDYIENTPMSPISALNTINKIQDTVDNLSTFPLMGAPLSSFVEIDTDYRLLVCGKYLAFYRLFEDIVSIDRLIYGKRDYVSILFGNIIRESDE